MPDAATTEPSAPPRRRPRRRFRHLLAIVIAALAVTRYQRAHGGELPGALDDLMPESLSGRLTDPYTGRELVYRREGKSYKVYGGGANRASALQ